MKRFSLLRYLAPVFVLVMGALAVGMPDVATAAVTITNPGFETGNLSGWTAAIPPGGSAFATSGGAAEGTYYARIKTNGPGSYTSVFQTITAGAGDTISGSARFDAGDYMPFDDDAMVVIRMGTGTGGSILKFVFYASVCLVGDFGSTGWRSWSHTFSAGGTYTIEARTSNKFDSIFDSSMGLDGPNTSLPAAPTNPSPCGGAGGPTPPPADTTPPTTSTTVTGTAGTNGWYTSNVTVAFAATDNAGGSGVNQIVYSVNGGTPVVTSGSSASTTLTADGTYTITYYAVDNAGNTSTTATVNVKLDKTGPSASLAVTAGTLGLNGWYTSNVTVSTSGADAVSGPVTCTANQSQTSETTGAVFNGSCTNQAGLTTNAAPLTVKLDKTAPTVSCAATPGAIWPPNHKLVDITTQVAVNGGTSGSGGFVLVSVTSNEADNGLGDGDTANDIQGWATGTADTAGQVRAERSGAGSGRVYTITYQGSDLAGNTATCSATVVVPHDRG